MISVPAAGAAVVLVTVGFAPDLADAIVVPVDRPMPAPPGGVATDRTELVDGLARPSDIRITERPWGAHGTELDLQRRRRGVTTIVLGGIATNTGVAPTARAAHEQGCAAVFAEHVTETVTDEVHRFAFDPVFPRLGRVATADRIGITR